MLEGQEKKKRRSAGGVRLVGARARSASPRPGVTACLRPGAVRPSLLPREHVARRTGRASSDPARQRSRAGRAPTPSSRPSDAARYVRPESAPLISVSNASSLRNHFARPWRPSQKSNDLNVGAIALTRFSFGSRVQRHRYNAAPVWFAPNALFARKPFARRAIPRYKGVADCAAMVARRLFGLRQRKTRLPRRGEPREDPEDRKGARPPCENGKTTCASITIADADSQLIKGQRRSPFIGYGSQGPSPLR